MKNLDPKIVEKLAKELNVAPKTVRNKVSSLARVYPGTSLNALAHIYAQQYGKSVLTMLDKEDRHNFPSPNSVAMTNPLFNPKNMRIIKIGKEENKIYNNWLVQLLLAFFVVGIGAGTISQLLATWIAKIIHLIN